MKIKFLIPLIIFLILIDSPCFSEVSTRLRVIQASNIGSMVDASLRDIHSQLGTLFNFTSYRLLRDNTLNLSPHKSAIIPIDQGRSIEITLMEKGRNTVNLRVRIIGGKADILNTLIRLSSGRTVIIGGPRHGEGVAILAISANF